MSKKVVQIAIQYAVESGYDCFTNGIDCVCPIATFPECFRDFDTPMHTDIVEYCHPAKTKDLDSNQIHRRIFCYDCGRPSSWRMIGEVNGMECCTECVNDSIPDDEIEDNGCSESDYPDLGGIQNNPY